MFALWTGRDAARPTTKKKREGERREEGKGRLIGTLNHCETKTNNSVQKERESESVRERLSRKRVSARILYIVLNRNKEQVRERERERERERVVTPIY